MASDRTHSVPQTRDISDLGCQRFHLGLITVTAEHVRSSESLLRTVLFHNPRAQFHLHISATPTTTEIWRTLLETWELRQVLLTFYAPTTSVIEHLSNVKDMDKPVENIVFLDTNVRVMCDIAVLFDRVWQSHSDHIVGTNDLNFQNIYMIFINIGNLLRKQGDLSTVLSSKRSDHIFELPSSVLVDLTKESLQVDAEPLALYLADYTGAFRNNVFVEGKLETLDQIYGMNGEVFRHQQFCPIPGNNKMELPPLGSDRCDEYRMFAKLPKRLHLNFIGEKPSSSGEHTITLLTQFTLDRFASLEKMVDIWDGPFQAIMYGSELDAKHLLNLVETSRVLSSRKDTAFHVMYQRKQYYPINYLRNVLLNQSTTRYTLFNDVDLIPSANAQSMIQKHIETQHLSDKRVALVIPAFEQHDIMSELPTDRQTMLTALASGEVTGYRMNNKWNFGHASTNFDKWKTATTPYQVNFQMSFEPYVVLPTKGMPRYTESLLERMGDKIVYGIELFSRGYKLIVLNDVFIVHVPHEISTGSRHWLASQTYKQCGSTLVDERKLELKTLRQRRLVRETGS